MEYLIRIISILSFFVFSSFTFAEDKQKSDGIQKASEILDKKTNIHSTSPDQDTLDNGVDYTTLVYDLPNPGAPDTSRLIGAGTRSIGENSTYLSVLTPKHTGLTLNKQPTMYWFTSEPIVTPLEFVLISEQSITPVLKIPLVAPQQAGIQSISLSNYNVNLKLDTEYQWSIALISNPQMRSHDTVTSGKIMRINPTQSLKNQLSETPETTKAFIYAKQGVWYDLIANLGDLITKTPTDPLLRENRAQLLEQVGLMEVAEYERK